MERLINFDPQWINDVVITGINIFILFFAMSYLLFNPARDYLEKKKALEDVKTEIVSIASLMAGKAVAASMDVKIQDSLIQETLKEMGESTWQS